MPERKPFPSISKFEIRSAKSVTIPQIANPTVQNGALPGRSFGSFRHLNLFRISDFDIRISSEQEFSFKHYIADDVHPGHDA